ITSDHRVPPSAALVQRDLGTPARFLQVDSACTGFVDALMVADALLDRLGGETALVIGSDAMSHLLDPQGFRAQSIFGHGAGAVVLRRGMNGGYGVKAYSTGDRKSTRLNSSHVSSSDAVCCVRQKKGGVL